MPLIDWGHPNPYLQYSIDQLLVSTMLYAHIDSSAQRVFQLLVTVYAADDSGLPQLLQH